MTTPNTVVITATPNDVIDTSNIPTIHIDRSLRYYNHLPEHCVFTSSTLHRYSGVKYDDTIIICNNMIVHNMPLNEVMKINNINKLKRIFGIDTL